MLNDVLPKLLNSLGLATDGASVAAIQTVNAVKLGVHIGYLISYIEKNNYQNIGWEMGAIAFDVTQAVEGESSITVDGQTFSFLGLELN